MKKIVVPLIVLLILLAIGICCLAGYIGSKPINGTWLDKNIQDVTLEIHYAGPNSWHSYPWRKKDIMKVGNSLHITVDAETLNKHKDLIRQMLDTSVAPVDDVDKSHLDTKIYYLLRGKNGKVLFEVAMWGDKQCIFVNGVPCVEDPIFFDVLIPFLPEDAAAELQSYIDSYLLTK